MKHLNEYKRIDYSDFYKCKVGDYVIVKSRIGGYAPEYLDFASNRIGEIIGINLEKKTIWVQFDSPWNNGNKNDTNNFKASQVEFWSKDKEDLEGILVGRKYNL